MKAAEKSKPTAPAGRATSNLLGYFRVAFALLFAGALPAAELEVSGGGWWHSRELKRTVELLVRPNQAPEIEAGAIEDAALILISELQGEGYLRPKVTARVQLADRVQEFTWDETLTTLLPRPLAATKVEYRLEPGVRYEVIDVAIEGLTALSASEGEAYFRAENYLLPIASTRIYTPARFERAQSNLLEELRQRGYANATVTGEVTKRDDASGAVGLRIKVNEGRRWTVAGVEIAAPAEPKLPGNWIERQTGRPFSPLWEQSFTERLRRRYQELGYADAKVVVTHEVEAATGGYRPVRVQATVDPGARIVAGPTRFTGSEVVRPSVLARQVALAEGEPLDPSRVAETRERLIRLGVFRSVDLHYEPADGPVRSPVFELEGGREQDFNLLAGWGSYERLRAGLEYRHYNVFSRAHQVRVDLVQSLKSSRGEAAYIVPGLFGESIDGTANLFGLRRQERAFRREEYGGSVGLKKHVPELGGDVSATYTYQSLKTADSTLGTTPLDLTDAIVASLDLAFLRDRQDNPLRPRRGYRLFARTEFASKYLGGEVDYQRIEVGGSWHRGIGRGRWIHVGASHGVVTTFGGVGSALPVNKRFFPGGENTVRGFAEGGATQRAPDGSYVGAKSYVQLNLEFEQALTRSWSAVVFGDAVGVADRLNDYPMDQTLGSVGVGIRYHSLIGPIRLEYGHNTNPRPGDPRGTLHFSVGFPF